MIRNGRAMLAATLMALATMGTLDRGAATLRGVSSQEVVEREWVTKRRKTESRRTFMRRRRAEERRVVQEARAQHNRRKRGKLRPTDEQALVNSMTNWQRNQYNRLSSGYGGNVEDAARCLAMEHPRRRRRAS